MLHVSQVSEIGGLTHCLVGYVTHQTKAGWKVSLACPSGLLQEEAILLGADVHAWAAERAPGMTTPREVRALDRIIRATAPDVVHLHCAKAGLAGRLAVRGRRPTVYSPHAWSWRAVTGAVRHLALAWEHVGAGWTDRTVCVSEAERQEGLDAGLRGPWEVVPNSVDLAPEILSLERGQARAALGVDVAEPVVVCVGRLCRQKGQDILLRAWAEVSSRRPAARLVLVGGGPMREEVRAAAESLPRVHLTGTTDRERALSWLVAADVVALPSRWEGMSIALLEARALGRFVVAADVAGMREGLAPQRGALVPPEDPHALASALVAALDEPASSSPGPELPGAYGSPMSNGERLLEIYDAVLRERSR